MMAGTCFAKDYYVYIKKTGDSKLQGKKGDIISIIDVNKVVPTKKELQSYYIIIVDLTEQEKEELLYEQIKEGLDFTKQYEPEDVIAFREKSVDIKSLNLTKQKVRIEKSIFNSVVTSKSLLTP